MLQVLEFDQNARSQETDYKIGLNIMFFQLTVATLIPKNLCAIILSTIYLSPKNLGIKFELIWATENLGTNSSKNERYITEPSVVYLP